MKNPGNQQERMKGYAIPVRNMNDKNKFQEMLGDILEVARVQGNQLGMNEIKSLFGDMNLSEEQYEHIFAYLAANHIKIKGYVETENEYAKAVRREEDISGDTDSGQDEPEKVTDKKRAPSHTREEDSAYLRMYLEDLKEIRESTPEEESILMEKIAKGDAFAKNRYVEGNLHYVVKIAEDYKNQGVTLEDLIQEGNMGLISSLEAVSALTGRDQGKETVTDFIRRFMEAAIAEQKESSSFEDNVIKKINYIRDAANELAEDLGREANIHELAGYVKMPEDEISDILHMAVEGVNLDNNHSHGHASHHKDGHGHNHSHGQEGHNHNHGSH